MALSIGISSGSKINVGDHCVRVKAVIGPLLMVINVDGGRDFMVSDKERVNILPEVYVFAGGSYRLAFEAPRRIPIHRQEAE